jgi:hypothetical protein
MRWRHLALWSCAVMAACAVLRPGAAEALQDPYFAGAEAEAEAASDMLQRQVQLAVAFAGAEQRRRAAELAAFEAELNML